MKKQIVLKVNDDDWTFTIFDDKDYDKKHSPESCAMTIFDDYAVDFKKGQFCLEDVLHELIHVHYKYCYTDSARLTAHDIEEIFCELISDRISLILKQARKIYKKLK